MSQQIIDTGGEAGAGGGDDLFTAFTKVNDNFTEIYSGNVTAANIRVYSVAGRIGNVVLTAQDVFGAATYSNIAVLQQNINAANIAAQNYTNAAVASLGPLPNVTITGGNISGVRITNSYGTLANLTVSGISTLNDDVQINGGLYVDQSLVLGTDLIFADSTVQTTAFQGFGNIFTNAAAQATQIKLINANVTAANAVLANVVGNLSIVGTTIYVQNSGEEITLQPNGIGNVYIGQSGANDLVLGKGVWFDDGTYQDTAYTAGEYVTDAELSSNVTALGQRINAANAAIASTNANVAAANARISTLSSTISAQAISDAANVAAANAVIASTTSKISAANLAIASTNANVTAANAVIASLSSDVSTLQSDVALIDLTDVNANVAAANAAIAVNTNRSTAANLAIAGLRANIIAANAQIVSVAAGQTAANAEIVSLQGDITSVNSDIGDLQTFVTNLDSALDIQAVEIVDLRANVTAANVLIAGLTSNLSNANDYIAQVDLDAANNAVAISLANASINNSNSRVNAANAAIAGLCANIIASNAHIAATDAGQTAANSVISSLVLSDIDIRANVEAANLSILSSVVRVHAANAAINGLRANITAANIEIVSTNANVAAANAVIATLLAFDPIAVNANMAAANVIIAFQGTRITTSNVLIAQLRANIEAANAQISTIESSVISTDANVAAANLILASLGSGNLNQIEANVSAANLAIAGIRANITASNVRIGRLESNISAGLYANAALVLTNANVAAANAAIAAVYSSITDLNTNASVQSAAISTLQGNALSQGLLISSKAPINSPALTGAVTVTGTVDVSGNVAAANVVAGEGSFVGIFGQLKTNAQPYVTSIGTLSNLTVAGNISGYGITSLQGFTGQLKTAAQPLVTSLGVLTGLVVTGTTEGRAFVGNTLNVDTSVTSPLVTATTLVGTVSTPAQPNITSLGNLSALAVDGTTNLTDVIVAGNIRANASLSSLAVNSLRTTSAFATTANITTLANIQAIQGNSAVFALDVQANNLIAVGDVTATRVIATGVASTIETAAQPNITSLGTLTGLAVTGNVGVTGNVSTTGNVSGSWFVGNVLGRAAIFTGNVTTGNLSAAYLTGVLKTSYQPAITQLGNLVSLNVDGDTVLAGNLSITNQFSALAASQGIFNTVTGALQTAAQPNITSVGTLTGLAVTGTVNVTGSGYVSQDLWVLGNLFVDGNTTTINAGNVTTTDKDLTLANNAISSTAARGAGIYIGDGGVYGNLSIYDGEWATPNDFTSAGNITGTKGSFTTIVGTLATANQSSITSIGTLGGLTVAGDAAVSNISATYGGTFANVQTGNLTATSIYSTTAVVGTFAVNTDFSVGGLLTVANVVFADGSFQTTTANTAVAGSLSAINANVTAANVEIVNLQSNISAANSSISDLSGNVSTLFSNAATQQTQIDSINANVSAANVTVDGFSSSISTLVSNAATQQTEINSLNANVTAANLEISSTNANVAAANAVIAVLNTVNLSGDPNFAGNVSATSFISKGNVQSGGPYATGNTIIWNNAGNATITTNSANLYINNFNAGVYATPFLGNVIVDANLQINANAVVRANLYVGNIYGYAGSFTNVAGTLTTAAQLNITSVGTLTSLAVTGNVTAGNVTAGNVSATGIDGTLKTAAQPNITTLGTLSDLSVAGNITSGNITVANLSVTNTFALTGSLNLSGDVSAANITATGNTVLAVAWVNGNIYAGGNVFTQGAADFGGNISTTAQGLRLTNSTLDNNLYTGFVTASGNLSVTGNAATASLTTGPITGLTVNLTGATPATDTTTGALVVAGGAGIGGNLWTGGNANVGGSLRTTNIIAEGPVYFQGQINLNNSTIETNQAGVSLFNAANTDYITMGGSAIDIKIGDDPVLIPGVPYGVGNTYIRHSMTIAGNLHANSNTIVRSTVESNGAYTGALQVFGGAWIGANVYATGNADIGGTARISGQTYIGGNTHIDGNTGINGNVTLISNITTIAGNIRTTGANLNITANTTVKGESSVIGNLTIIAPYTTNSNTLTVSGNISGRQNLYIAETIYSNSLVVAGGIGIPAIDGTPIGAVTPFTGAFTTLEAFTWYNTRPRSNQRPRLMLDFANNPNLDPRINFNRNSVGTYFNAAGDLATASAYQPRFDYLPDTLTPLGLLIEESRTNYFKYSNSFTDASYWDPLGGTVQTLANTTNPAGSYVGGAEIIEDGNNVIHAVYPDVTNNQITATATNYYVASAFVKAGLRTQFAIQFENEGTGPFFDTVTGTVVQEGSAPGGFTTTSEIKSLANGWFRISTVLYKQTTNGNVIFALAEGGSLTYSGQAGAAGGYIYGAQLEVGSFVTSYVPTTTAAVTREADDVSISSTNFSSFYDNNDGLIFVDSLVPYKPTNKTGAINGVTPVTSTLRPTLVSIEGSSFADRIAIVAENITIPTATRFANLIVYNSGALQANLGTNDTHFLTITNGRVAAYYNTNAFGITTNGNLAAADTVGTVPSNLNVMYIGRGTGTNYLNGTIAKISYFSRTSVSVPLGEELRALTAQ